MAFDPSIRVIRASEQDALAWEDIPTEPGDPNEPGAEVVSFRSGDGAFSFGLWQKFGRDYALETQREIVLHAFDLGITHFDLANNYGPPAGSAEENFGRLLASDLAPYRDEIIVSSRTDLSCSVGVSSSFCTSSCVISSTRARASGGSPASFGSRRASSDWRMVSNRSRRATTVGMISRDCSQVVNRSTSSSTIASARSSSPDRRVRFSFTMPWRSSML